MMRELSLYGLDSVGGGRDDALAVQVLATAATVGVWSSWTDRTNTEALFTAIKRSWIPTAIVDVVCAKAFPDPAIDGPLGPINSNYNRWACAILSGTVQSFFHFGVNPLAELGTAN
ncbi:hypothetical protein [Bordetella sp. 02P26C-1]|uniref:hypothetical protein n=1 Tax=Bordetella sp. 02P26C-1 TaxID=2683195 RepID=UPI001355794E|nr:hypothetical protein [Bordetella sp. 02P26C-1]MVW80569.1 hypothetical protein [Bordetella sp. 02P26C-1]